MEMPRDAGRKVMGDLGAELLPRWDLTPFFPTLDSPEFERAFDEVCREVQELTALFESSGVRRGDPLAHPGPLFDEVTGRMNALYRRFRLVYAYVSALVTTDAADAAAQSRFSELRIAAVGLDQLWLRWTAWVGSQPVEALLAASASAREHEYVVRRASEYARYQMPEGEEALAAMLRLPGLSAWARLHSDLTSLLTVTLTVRGEEQKLPMSSVRSLASDPDREVRRLAYEAELRAWESVAVPLAAALNGVKGHQRVVRERRGFADDTAPTLLDNGIDAGTLAAMQQACVESFPDFRRYMRAKSRALGVPALAWYDLGAPVGAHTRQYSWVEAERFICEQFATYSDRMAAFAEQAFRERWIDARPRPGKEGGAYCASLRPGESRILMNYDHSFNSVSTLAHELGHGYHNLNLEPRPPLQARTPMTLAETASIFCETLACEAALRTAAPEERLALVEASLQRDLMVVVDIHSRFLFEGGVFARRARRELSVRELNELMLETQRETYGDGLDPELLHPYMWAVKGHYYGPTFYNYPYAYGLLFGLGLYARYQADPDEFRAGYDALLSSTGLADGAALGERFGIDVRSPEFWRSSLDVIRANIHRFETLVDQAFGAPGAAPPGERR